MEMQLCVTKEIDKFKPDKCSPGIHHTLCLYHQTAVSNITQEVAYVFLKHLFMICHVLQAFTYANPYLLQAQEA